MWELVFDDKGVTASAAGFADDVARAGVTDLFVFSHGWNTAEDSARRLYAELFPLVENAASGVAGLGTIGFVGVLWPSLWFPETKASVAPASGSTQAAGSVEEARSGTDALSGAEIAASLATGFADPAPVLALGRILDEAQEAARAGVADDVLVRRFEEFHALLGSLAATVPEYEDAGERALLTSTDPTGTYQALAEVFGSAPAGGAQQGIGDWFGRALGGAKDALRVFSYNVMKARAGEVGRKGLGPLLSTLRGVRVHLIGHSFGARLVSFALAGVGDPSPVASLLLLQGAFSHWSFAHAKDNPFGEDGALHAYANRVRGPLVATYTRFDLAVCRWYPKASFLARADQSASTAGRWGGMGEDGFQAVTPSADRVMRADGTTKYDFEPGTFYRVNAEDVINDTRADAFAGAHSDFVKPAVARLVVAAASHS
ncbi:hypothetical protein CLV71_10385 [Actinophytocola oryzae]|uniref:Serine-threonine protein kinase n=2 Tax=Actinophytocola oryzae TaxID=502181 RepID=A0A4R7VYM3_9PSEU|nr:hypothetical protein CLV71_10385 [Actinophytocola oryzae]